jgi:hypothetical protein
MKEYEIKNYYAVSKSNKEQIFKVIKIITDDSSSDIKRQTDYLLDNGETVSSNDYYTITIPNLISFYQVLSKYPNAIDDTLSDFYGISANQVLEKYKETSLKRLVNELNYHQECIDEIKKKMGLKHN